MLNIAILVFAIGAVGGLVLANTVLRGRLASWPLSLLHMALGATGLVLTVFGGASGISSIVPIALFVLVVAALGGFFLASFHARQIPGPKPVVVIHASVAVIGFLLLVGGAFHFL
jgi:hypothetical protein